MARKITSRHHATTSPRILFTVLCSLFTLAVAGSILRINPSASSALNLSASGAPLPVAPPFPAPKNVEIVRWPDDVNPTSVRITWDPVPGATSYQVYSAVALEDSTKYIPVNDFIVLPDGSGVWAYKYSKHPIFGDVMFFRPGSPSALMQGWAYGGYGSGTVALFSPFSPDTLGYYDGASYYRPLTGERDRFFYVRAVRS